MGAMRSVAAGSENAEPDWQRLWFTLQARTWTSLAVIGTDEGADAERVARLLASVGNRDGLTSVRAFSALGMTFEDVPLVVAKIAEPPVGGGWLLVSCDPLRRNPAMIPVLHAVTGVVLVVRLGESLVSSVTKTVETVGRDKVFASIAIG